MRHLIVGLVITSLLIVASAAPVFAGQPGRGMLWLDGEQVRTLVPPAASPKKGRDALYRVPEIGPVASVGPGDKGYHGGHWKVYDVVILGSVDSLTSEAAILDAKAAGLVDIIRVAADDFRCPIQP